MTSTTLNRIQVTFDDFEDLSSRLVLLPRIEDEGKGAVVASYSVPTPESTNSKEGPAAPIIETASSDSTECRDEKEDRLKESGHNKENLVGFVLVGTADQQDLKTADFASILSAMRGQPGPIVLELEPANASSRHDKSVSGSESGDHDGCSSSSDSVSSNQQETQEHVESQSDPNNGVPSTITSTNNNTAPAGSLLSGRLSAWGSRMKASAQLAAEAASQAAHTYQVAAASRAAKGSACETEAPPCGLHVQTSLGAFLPLHKQNGGGSTPRSSELAVTSSSVLYIRRSAVEACPPRGYTYQWYKGLPYLDSNSPLEEWIELADATNAAFQPSTTEVGYKLLCLVTVDKHRSLDSSLMDSDSEEDSESEDDSLSKEPAVIWCFTPSTVAADLSLFNGARQALVRGAHFGGLVGKGNAQGRTFRVQVEMGYQHRQNKKKKRVASSVKVDQVSGETAEPLHADPFHRVSANSSHANSKALELKFRSSDLSDNASLMSALVTEEGLLELVAPNRFARESLLLAIGIANFKGKPADLEATTVLFPPLTDDENELERSISEESSSSGGSGSCNSSSTAEPEQTKQPLVVESLALSPANSLKRRPSAGSMSSHSSAGDLSTIASAASVEAPMSSDEPKDDGSSGPSARELELEREVAFLRAKLTKKDKVVSELQRQVARSEGELQQSNQQVSQCEQKVTKMESELQSCQRVQKAAEQMVDQHVATMTKLKADHASQMSKLNQQLKAQSSTIADLEKTVQSHHNEKAVLSAGVEARESKLAKMTELQEQFVALSSKVSQQDQWRKDLEETNQRYQELKADLQKVTQLETDCRQDLESTKATLQSVEQELQMSKRTAESCRSDLKDIQTKNQKLKSERNSYKQKADSLSKEIARICRNGRTLADIERMLANHEAQQEEVQLLRKQKRKALEEAHSYRKSYEQSRAAQELMSQTASGSKNSSKDDPNKTAHLLERNVELERLVTDLTEYVNAKEMQLETMKQVNTALQEEIHGLAQANMHKNDI